MAASPWLGKLLWRVLCAQFPAFMALPTPVQEAIVEALDLTIRCALKALHDAQIVTLEQGWHFEFDNDNPARPPHIVRRRKET